jgi:hypothetical protein
MAQGFIPKTPKPKHSKYPAQLPGESKRAYAAFCKFFDSEKAGRPIEYPTRHRQCWDGWRDRNHWPLRVMGLPLPPIETFSPPEDAPPKLEGERDDQYQAFVCFWRAIQVGDRFPLESAQQVYKAATGKPGNFTQWKDKFRWNTRCGLSPVIPTTAKSLEKPSKADKGTEARKGKEKQTQTQTTRDLLTLAQSQQSSIRQQLQQAIDYLDGDLQAIATLMECPIGMPLVPIDLAEDCPVQLPEASISASRLLRGLIEI